MANSSTEYTARQVQKVPTVSLNNTTVYYTKQGENFACLTYMAKMPNGKGGRMEAMSETKEVANIKRSMKKLVGIIRANFGLDFEREAHLTITYRGSMTDTNKLQGDLEKFIKRLRRAYKEHQLEYIAIMEPHGHGGWHIHLLIKSDMPLWHANRVIGLSYNQVRKIWREANGTGAGNIDLQQIPTHVVGETIKDYGKYFVAYFTTAIPEDVELSGDRKAIKEASKQAQKGSRLHFYPANFKFYRTSQGIYKPKQVKKHFEAEEMEDFENTYASAFAIMADDGSGGEKRVQFVQQMEFRKK